MCTKTKIDTHLGQETEGGIAGEPLPCREPVAVGLGLVVVHNGWGGGGKVHHLKDQAQLVPAIEKKEDTMRIEMIMNGLR